MHIWSSMIPPTAHASHSGSGAHLLLLPSRTSCILISAWIVYLPYLCNAQVVPATEVAVTSAKELAEAVESGASTIIIQSRITGLPGERLARLDGTEEDLRYADFPEVPEECLSTPEKCLADDAYVTFSTPLTIKSDGSTLWDMSYETRRIIAGADFVIQDVRLQGFAKDVAPMIYFFIFHNDANVICQNCWIEQGCSGPYAQWGTELEPATLSDDGLSIHGSFELGLAQDLTAGTRSKQTFLNSTFSCNPDLLPTGALLEPDYNPDETCQRADDNGESYRGTKNTTGHGHTCQAWGSSTPNAHSRLPGAYPEAGLAQNFCRNPDNADAVWCYTIDGPRWQYCDVPICKDVPEDAAIPSAQDGGLPQGVQGVAVHTTSSAGALSRRARVAIIAGAGAVSCLLLLLVTLGLCLCCKKKGQAKKSSARDVLDPASSKARFQSAQAAVGGKQDVQDPTSDATHANITAQGPPFIQSGSSSDDYSQRSAATAVSPKVPAHIGTARDSTYMCTVSQDTSFSLVKPGPNASTSERAAYLDFQLDSLKGVQVLGRLVVLDKVTNRRHGGQAVVQVVEDMRTHVQYAMKFFLSPKAFQDEMALYEDPMQPLGQFLPEVHSVVESGTLVDAEGMPLPPCIVMEKGESLDLWAASTGDGLDMVTGLQVLTHVADRLKDLHAAGYVHRDIKPGNVLWLPRKKRWTLIDFGCVARTGEQARAGFTLTYAAPEAVRAQRDGVHSTIATEALDAWSVGILAIEIFTGQPAFNAFESKVSKAQMIIGEKLAPWEDETKAALLAKRFGHLKGPVLALLDRNPAARPSMAALQHACHSVLSNTTTTQQYAHEVCESVGSRDADVMLCCPPITMEYETVEGGVSCYDSTDSSLARERGAQAGLPCEKQHLGLNTVSVTATADKDTET